MKNVSDETQAEANLREEQALAETIVSSYLEPIVILNAELNIVNSTPSFAWLFNLDRQSLIGKNLYNLTNTGINVPQLQSVLDPIVKSNNFHASFELEFSHPVKGKRSLLVKPRRIYQPPNLLFSLEFEDLTDNKALMEEKDVFISVASHEIRTPLTVIKAYGQVLQKELNEAKPIIKKAVQKISEQTDFMSALVSSLLDTSKISSGKLSLQPELFDLSDLVEAQVESFNLVERSHHVHINKAEKMAVYADKVRTGSMISNLLSNAVKYSPDNKEINVTIKISDSDTVIVSVQDFGMGIPVNEQGKIFHRFGRTDSVKQKRIPGTGLGLHLAAELVKLQGGQIGFTSVEGQGSTFYFSFPCAQ